MNRKSSKNFAIALIAGSLLIPSTQAQALLPGETLPGETLPGETIPVRQPLPTRVFKLDPELLATGPSPEQNPALALNHFFRPHNLDLTTLDPGSWFYNTRTGELSIRATPDVIGKIEAAVASVAYDAANSPPEVKIEVSLAEIPDDPDDELAAQFFDERIQGGRIVKEGLTKIATATQVRTIMRALEQKEGVDIVSAPPTTTLSGRNARIQIESAPAPVLIPPFHAPGKTPSWEK